MAFGVKPVPVMPVFRDQDIVASNPLEALVPTQKLKALQSLPKAEQHQYMGRLIDGIFQDPSYQAAVDRVAQKELADLSGKGSDDITDIIGQAVEQALRARGM